VPFRRPKQGNQTQRARTRTPDASIWIIGSCGDAIRFHGGCCHGEGVPPGHFGIDIGLLFYGLLSEGAMRHNSSYLCKRPGCKKIPSSCKARYGTKIGFQRKVRKIQKTSRDCKHRPKAGAYNAWTFFDFSEFFLPYVELIPGSDFSATISKILARTLFFEKRPGSGRDVLCAQKRPG
jgi:hypothetical protein